MTTKSDPTCEERIDAYLGQCLEDLRQFREADRKGEEYVEDLGTIEDYGLCFDYVQAGTFSDQDEGYFRWQLSWGGPGDEFRIFVDAAMHCHRIEYWFLDWFDGAHRVLTGEDRKLLEYFVERFREHGTLDACLGK